MTDRLRTVAIAISVVGIAIAGYLTYVHYAGISPVCEIAHGCEKVQTSSGRGGRHPGRRARPRSGTSGSSPRC